MKIVDRKTFLALPADTLFSKYSSERGIGDMMIKGATWTNDFLFQQIVDAIKSNSDSDADEVLERAEATGESFEMDFNCLGRDGLFDEEQLFLVWEKADVEALIARLSSCAA